MLISVTATHIEAGSAGSPGCCAVSLALRDVYPGEVVSVMHVWTRVGKLRVATAASVYSFIRAFDQGKPVRPFSFELGTLTLSSP